MPVVSITTNVPWGAPQRYPLRRWLANNSQVARSNASTVRFNKESGVPLTGIKVAPKTPSKLALLPGLGSQFVATLGLIFGLTGCAFIPDVRHKPQVINPFPQITTVAVLPFFNQSQEPTLSGQRVAEAYMHELQSIRGFQVLPIGVVQGKILELNRPLATGQDFQALAQHMGVDAVLVGSITDYEAYYPPRMTIKVSWYAANPGFHPVMPGYGLPWGTKREKDIPRWVHLEAQRSLATEQLKTQTPSAASSPESTNAIMPEDRRAAGLPFQHDPTEHSKDTVHSADSQGEISRFSGDDLPADWPDPNGFIPDPPAAKRPELIAQHEPIISHISSFNGSDEDFTEQLANYFYFRDDARFGGWQAYLQRSEDFISFCCYLHLHETLISRGGQDKSRLILRWPIDRYTR
jgi:hypothetical protein